MKASLRSVVALGAIAALFPVLSSCASSAKKKKPEPQPIAVRAPSPTAHYQFKISQTDAKTLAVSFTNQGTEALSIPVETAGSIQVTTAAGQLFSLVTAQQRELAITSSALAATRDLAPGETVTASVHLDGRVDLLSGSAYLPQSKDRLKMAWNNNHKSFVSNEVKVR